MTDIEISHALTPEPTERSRAGSSHKRTLQIATLVCTLAVLTVIALFARNWTEALIAAVPILLVIYIALSQLLARVVQPLEDVAQDTARLARGDVSRMIAHENSVVVGPISRNLNKVVRQMRDAEGSATKVAALNENAERQRRAAEEAKLSYDNLLLVSELGQQIVASLDLSDIATRVYETLNTMMDASTLRLAQFDRTSAALHVLLTMDDKFSSEPYTIPMSKSDNFMVWCASHGREVFLNDVPRDHARYVKSVEWVNAPGKAILSLICTPMFAKGEVVGVIAVGSTRANAYSSYHLDMIKSLGTYIALALDNASAYQKLDRALTDLKHAQRQLVQSEKMSSLGLLTAGIAHEINNPINFVSANVNPLRRNLGDVMNALAMYRDAIRSGREAPKMSATEEQELDYTVKEIDLLLGGIEEGAQRAAEIVQGLRNFSRTDEQALKYADIHQGIDSTLTLLHNKYKDRVTVVKEYGDLQEIECYAGQLNQVFMNILSNAIQAIEGDGTVTIRTQKLGDRIEIRIKDTGAGMSEDVRKHIFDPFFTTKDVGVGTGLGLSISYGIIEKHNGTIEVQSAVGIGSEFIITLPIAQEVNNTQAANAAIKA